MKKKAGKNLETTSLSPAEKLGEGREKSHKKFFLRLFSLLFTTSIVFIFLLLILFFSCILYWEKYDVPVSILVCARNTLLEKDWKMNVKRVRTVFPFTVEAEGFSLVPVNRYDLPRIKAEKVRFTVALSDLFSGIFFPIRFRMENAEASLPLFPSLKGMEGAEDRIELKDFSMEIQGEKGKIRLKKLKGECCGCIFEFSGTVNNFLHSLASKTGHVLIRNLWEKELYEKSSGSLYHQWVESCPEEIRMYLAAFSRILREKGDSNADILSFPWRMSKEKPSLKASFHIDLYDFSSCEASAFLILPESTAGSENLHLKKTELFFTLSQGVLEQKRAKIDLEKESFIAWEGRYDEKKKTLSANVEGKCSLQKILPFLPGNEKVMLEKYLGNNVEKEVAFSCKIASYSVKNRTYEIFLDFSLPEFSFQDIRLEKSSFHIRLTPEGIKGKFRKLPFTVAGMEKEKKKGALEVSFLVSGDTFRGDFSGTLPFAYLEKNPSFAAMEIKGKGENTFLTFKGDLVSEKLFSGKTQGNIRFQCPEFFILGSVPVKVISPDLAFDMEKLTIKTLKLFLADTLSLSFTGDILPGEKKLNIALQCNGTAEEVIKTLSPRYRKELEKRFEDVQWPEKGALSDLSAQIFLDYGKKPSYWFAEGNIVMSDFKYRKIFLRYFATRFLLDSYGRLSLPGSVLETEKGRAVLNCIYEERKEKNSLNNSSGKLFSGNGTLVFDLKSTMNGNDVLHFLYPQWKSEFLDFPYPLSVTSSGTIDYRNDAATFFTARITNGECYWQKALLSNVDCLMQYANEKLTISKATAVTCNGNLSVDYSFDFNEKREKGKIALKLKNADFSQLMKGMNADLKQLKGIQANCSGEMAADLAYNEKDDVLLYGKGKADISGEDMWHIPVFGELLKILGKAWHTDSLGTITKFNMAFSLNGTVFRIDKGRSNGNVVALRTEGTYDWHSEEFDFRIQSELLKGTLPFAAMSKVLTPVSWILQKRIRGKGEESKWDEVSSHQEKKKNGRKVE